MRLSARLPLFAVLAALLAAPALAQSAPPAAPNTATQAPAALPGDPFGDEVVLAERQMLAMSGTTTWDDAFETLKEAFQTVAEAMRKFGLTAAGPPIAVYTRADDAGFDYEAGLPLAAPPATALPPGELAVKPLPAGRAIRFTHRGSYDNMDSTYEALTNLLDDRRIDVRDLYMEEYLADPLTTDDEKLHIVVYVFPK